MSKCPLFASALLTVSFILGACASRSTVAPVVRTVQGMRSIATTRPVVYVAGLSNAVVFYTASLLVHNPQPLGSITAGITRASGLWVDGNGTLYVVDTGYPAKVLEFKQGASAPFKTITKGFYAPLEPAVDSSGTLYIDEAQNGGVIHVYPPGASSPSRSITIPPHGRGGPSKMAFDKKGDLLVATFDVKSNTGSVYKVAPGSSVAVNLNLVDPPGSALGTDAAGNIYVGGVEGNIFVYAPASKIHTRTIDAGQTGFYSSLSVTADGTIYWPNYDNNEMFEFAPGALSPTNVFLGGGGIDAAVGIR